jgi:hypothetical protein
MLEICKQIMILIHYKITLSEFYNFVFHIISFFVPEVFTGFLSYIVHSNYGKVSVNTTM